LVEEKVSVKTNGSTRVGFVLPEGHWLGGRNYLRNLSSAIRALPGNKVIPVVFTGKRQTDASPHFPEVEIVASSMLDPKLPAWFFRKVTRKAISQDILLQRLLQKHRISVLSHSFHLGSQTAIKTIG
jgi:hypothetical protein